VDLLTPLQALLIALTLWLMRPAADTRKDSIMLVIILLALLVAALTDL